MDEDTKKTIAIALPVHYFSNTKKILIQFGFFFLKLQKKSSQSNKLNN